MARYIDAEKLKRNIRVNLMPNVDVDGTVTVENAERYFLNLIDKTTTADVAEVVHCNVCVRHGTCIFEDTFNTTGLADEYRFCGVGKRKENEINKTDYEMALSVLENLEVEQNTPHILIGIAFAKAAVEKQIPKKPTDIKLEYDGNYGKCPCCGESVMDFDEYTRCKKCGQALDWSEDNGAEGS